MSGQRREAAHDRLRDHMTPTTAGLLRWWFGADRVQARRRCAFTEGQRHAIVHTIASHEAAHNQHRVAPPRHRVNLADETERVQVLLALMVWQLLNLADARAAGAHDPRFTRHFAVITTHRATRDHLLNALWGQLLAGGEGARDFGTAGAVRCADLLIPEARRDEVYAFLCGSARGGESSGQKFPGEDLIAITDQRLETLACLVHLPQLMVFAIETGDAVGGQENAAAAGRKQLRRLVSLHGKPCMEVVFSHRPDHPADPSSEP